MATIPIIASLPGKVALVTEASQSAGCHVARTLAEEGAHLALHYSNSGMSIVVNALGLELQNAYPALIITTHQGDLTTAEGVDAVFASVLREHPRIDYVVKQDGAMARRVTGDVSEDESHQMLAYAVFVDSQRRIWMERYNEAMGRARASRSDCLHEEPS